MLWNIFAICSSLHSFQKSPWWILSPFTKWWNDHKIMMVWVFLLCNKKYRYKSAFLWCAISHRSGFTSLILIRLNPLKCMVMHSSLVILFCTWPRLRSFCGFRFSYFLLWQPIEQILFGRASKFVEYECL